MRNEGWRSKLARRLGWSFGLATIWCWGLLVLRMLRDGLQPLEVWFGYSLSFFMTAVYVYLGLLIYSTVRAEARGAGDQESKGPGDRESGGADEAGGRADGESGRAGERESGTGQGQPGGSVFVGRRPPWLERLARAQGLLSMLGLLGLALAVVSLVSWLLLRYPGPQAVSGTYGSIVLALMVLGVAVISTAVARKAE